MSLEKQARRLAEIAQDYRADEGVKFDADHVLRWINQFDEEVREPVLAETTHVLDQAYIGSTLWEKWISKLATQEKLCGDDPCAFWSNTHLLEIQQRGASQRDLNRMFRAALPAVCPEAKLCEPEGAAQFVYLDDGIFSGTRLRSDICGWIGTNAPSTASIHIITPVSHSSGQWFASDQIEKAVKQSGKKLSFKYWNSLDFEDQKRHIDTSDVLRPTIIPKDDALQAYLASPIFEQYPPVLRRGNSLGSRGIFSSHEARVLLESQFLIHGARIRSNAPNLTEAARPLGFHSLTTLGFGTMMVTFRNCPNNCPLVFWAGNPWHPLFPRRSNSDTIIERMISDLVINL